MSTFHIVMPSNVFCRGFLCMPSRGKPLASRIIIAIATPEGSLHLADYAENLCRRRVATGAKTVQG